MALTVTMPQLGESVTEGTIARWLKAPGDTVGRYEAIAEVVTDKVNAEIPAPSAGTMGPHLVEEGAVVPVGGAICTIETEVHGASAPAPPAPVAATAGGMEATAPAEPMRAEPEHAAPEPMASEPTTLEPPTAAVPNASPESPPTANGAVGPGPFLHVTPAVRMLAREHGIDIGTLQGSGTGGRVTKRDLLTEVQHRAEHGHDGQPPGTRTASPPTPPGRERRTDPDAARPAGRTQEGEPPSPEPGDRLLPLTAARRAIAEHMVRSRATSPHAWVMVEVDMTQVVRARSAQRAAVEAATGVPLTFLPFVASAVIAALRGAPTLNASWSDEGIVVRHEIELGVAVTLDDNLIVPVLHKAGELNLAGLSRSLHDLTARARAGRLRVEELSGGTFTLNNAGALGTVMSQAIINQPQAAICVMDGIVRRPVVIGKDDAIAVRSMMNLSLSFDHRINDGAQATRFLVDVRRRLEGVEPAASLI